MSGPARSGAAHWTPRQGADTTLRPADWTVPCQEVGPDLFFPEAEASAAPAIAICHSCETRLPCLRYALDQPQQGVWGGFTEYGRRVAARQRARGRSLEDIIAADDAAHYDQVEAVAENRRKRDRERSAARRAAERAAREVAA